MPNPIAHPAASIPFAKAGLVFSALVVGSISPDFGYLVPIATPFFMYTIPGLFLFDVPVGLVLLWLFHALAKWPLLSLLPISLQRRLFKHAQGFTFGPLKRFLLILLSLLVGSITHIVWDSFTHGHGWTVQHFPVFYIPIGGMPLYTILQNGSTIIGIGILTYWFLRWWPFADQSDQILSRFSGNVQRLLLVLTVISFAIVEGIFIYWRLTSLARIVSLRFLMLSTMFSAFFIVSFFVGIYCVVWMIAFHKTIRGLHT